MLQERDKIAIQKDHYLSKHKKMEATLQAAEEEKERILNSISELVILHDETMIIQWANAAAEEALGSRFENLVGSRCYEVIHHRDAPCVGCPVQETLQTGEIHKKEIVAENGSIWQVKAFPTFNEEGRVIGAVEISKDITEKKRIEEEMVRLERLNLIGEMAAGFGHEIRNPMTTVRGFLQMLGEKEDCAHYQGHFEIMIEELDRANAIITEFLTMAKHKPVDLKEKNLNEVIQSIYPRMQKEALHGDMVLVLDLGEVPDVYIDQQETQQLILNLVRNALEAMAPGGTVTLKTYTEAETVVLAVRDQGTGIVPEMMNRLGIPFASTKEDGTGLGLPICYSIVQRHQAKLDVESGFGGTTFFIRYPKIK